MRRGGPSLAGIICLATLFGAIALATVLLGTLTPPHLFFCYAFGDLVFFLHYYRRLICVSGMRSGQLARWILGMTPVGCCALLLAVLRNWADPEVRDHWALQAGFVVAWGCAVIWTHVLGSLLGLDVLENGVEGRNPAAVWAGVGLKPAATLLGIPAVVEFLKQPTKRRPFTSVVRSAVGAAALYLCFAVAWLWHLGLGF
jgi:hypothetical protein